MSFSISRKIGTSTSIEWIIPDMVLMREVNLIDGRGDSGKSSAVAAIIGRWMERPVQHDDKDLQNILWLSQEEDFDLVIKPRLVQYGIIENQVLTIPYRNGQSARPRVPANHDDLKELIRRNNINCVVIDPFTELKEHTWNINDGDMMRAYMTSLSRLCQETGCTIFVIRHMRKSSGDYSADDGMGSAQIRDTARSVLRVDRTEELHRRYFLSVQKSNMAKPTMPLQFEFENTPHHFGKVKFLGHKQMTISEIKKLSAEKATRMKMDDAKQLLLEALKDGPKPCKQLIEEADANGIGERTLTAAKAELDVWSHRVKNMETNLCHFLWGLKEHSKPTKTEAPGDAMPQLTLEGLQPTESQVSEADAEVLAAIAAEIAEENHKKNPPDKAEKPKAKKSTPKPKGKGRGAKS